MKLALLIIAIVSILASAIFFFTTDKFQNKPVDMPWHVTVLDDSHSEVFGIQLNTTTLQQLRKRFGKLDGIALFQTKQGVYSLEAYFGKISIGPFSARLVANLDATQSELEKLPEYAVKRVLSEDGTQRWTLKSEKQIEQDSRVISSINYIPVYSGMDQQFIKERFGEPDRVKVVDETTQLWSYPGLGVRIMVDNEGKEMFEYMTVGAFKTIDGDL